MERAPGSAPGRAAPRSRRAGTLYVVAGLTLFLAGMAYLVASSLARPSVPTFEPTPVALKRPGGETRHDTRAAPETITVDARDAGAWRFVEFASGSVVTPPDTSGWDLAFRRYYIIASDAITDLGPVTFDSVTRAPERGYVRNTVARDTVNRAIRRWYDYGIVTHLLTPNGHVYVVRTRQGLFAKVEVLSYYCTGLAPGCVTFRYAHTLPPTRRTSSP